MKSMGARSLIELQRHNYMIGCQDNIPSNACWVILPYSSGLFSIAHSYYIIAIWLSWCEFNQMYWNRESFFDSFIVTGGVDSLTAQMAVKQSLWQHDVYVGALLICGDQGMSSWWLQMLWGQAISNWLHCEYSNVWIILCNALITLHHENKHCRRRRMYV